MSTDMEEQFFDFDVTFELSKDISFSRDFYLILQVVTQTDINLFESEGNDRTELNRRRKQCNPWSLAIIYHLNAKKNIREKI